MIGRRLTLLSLLCVAAAAVPLRAHASPPTDEVPTYATQSRDVITIDLGRVPTFDIVTPNFVVVRIVALDSSGHKLLKVAASSVTIPRDVSPILRTDNLFRSTANRTSENSAWKIRYAEMGFEHRQRPTRALRMPRATGKLTGRHRS